MRYPVQTLEAVKMVLNLSSNKRFNIDLLEKVMAMLEEQLTHLSDTQEAESSRSTSDDANQETRKYNQLLDIIGDILQQVCKLYELHFILIPTSLWYYKSDWYCL